MKATNQPKAKTAQLEKFENVSLNTKQIAMIKGGNGDLPPLPPVVNEIYEDTVEG